jgi:hypothetical protein
MRSDKLEDSLFQAFQGTRMILDFRLHDQAAGVTENLPGQLDRILGL